MSSGWQPFFLAQVGASAALTGLVFVALSINLAQIMEFGHLVGRAAEALILLVSPVIVGLVLLAPFATLRAAGLWAVLPATIAWAIVTRVLWSGRAAMLGERPMAELVTRVGSTQVATLVPLGGVVVMATGSSAGVALVAAGAALSIAVGIIGAWVLLVEILR